MRTHAAKDDTLAKGGVSSGCGASAEAHHGSTENRASEPVSLRRRAYFFRQLAEPKGYAPASMRPSEAREAIVRRRAQFVASALAATGLISMGRAAEAQEGAADAAPEASPTDAGETEPEVCLCACEAVGMAHAPAGLIPLAAAGLVALARRKPRRSAAPSNDK
jgi:hypothetical protein